ncbi:MAG: alpha/beta hydrolase [Pseudomonadota bacterium]
MTPLILLPGMMCDARLFQPQIDALSKRGPVLTPGIDAFGSMIALAAEILRLAPPRFALAGLSMGGIAAMEVLRQAPDRVTRIALMDTNPLAETPEAQARRLPQIARVLAGGLDTVMRDEMKPLYLADTPRRRDILDLCMDMARKLGPQVFARQSRALASRPDQTATLAAFKGPALVLMGEHDIPCPRPRHDLMHRLMPQSRLAIVDGAGHLPTLEKPTKTTAELLRWLEE